MLVMVREDDLSDADRIASEIRENVHQRGINPIDLAEGH